MRITKKLSSKTIRSRILSHLSNSAMHWGLDMERAKREEARAYALLKANKDLALSLAKQGWLSQMDMKAIGV
jgi:hypothetical protein